MPTSGVDPQRTTIDAGAVTLSALLYGENDAPAVVVSHGWADSAWSMDCVAQALASRFRVISLDLRGHGHSGRGPYNMINLVGDLRGAIEALEVASPIIIGHSLGGQVSAQFCGLYPEIPSGLVLVEGVGPPEHRLARTDPDLLERENSQRQAERTRRRPTVRTLSGIDEAFERLRTAHPLLDEKRARLLATENTMAAGLDDGERVWRFDPTSRDWFNGHSQVVAAQRWRGITCPVQVVQGADAHERYWKFISDDPDDFSGPLVGEALEERLSHFGDPEYVEIAGAGHMLPYDKPDELNAVIVEFLDRLSSDR